MSPSSTKSKPSSGSMTFVSAASLSVSDAMRRFYPADWGCRRSAACMARSRSLQAVMFLLFVIFIVVPIAELYVIIQIGQSIGVLPTIALLIIDSILGSMLMRHQGRAAWWRFNRALAEGRVPGREVIDGVLVIFGGALLL